jgi:hypothetical protein
MFDDPGSFCMHTITRRRSTVGVALWVTGALASIGLVSRHFTLSDLSKVDEKIRSNCRDKNSAQPLAEQACQDAIGEKRKYADLLSFQNHTLFFAALAIGLCGTLRLVPRIAQRMRKRPIRPINPAPGG